MAAKLRPRVMLPLFVPSTAARAAEARGRQLQRLDQRRWRWDVGAVARLRQAGVPVEFVRLEQRGIRGNGHMVMMEKNNLQVADLIERWIRQRVEP